MTHIALTKEALQALITSLQKSYDDAQKRFDELGQQIVKLENGSEKGAIKKEQSEAKDHLDKLGGQLAGLRKTLNHNDDDVGENHTDDRELHSSRQILLPYRIHEQLEIFLFLSDPRYKKEEIKDILEMFDSVYRVYCELYRKETLNLIDICNDSNQKERYESLGMPHPWIVVKEKMEFDVTYTETHLAIWYNQHEDTASELVTRGHRNPRFSG